MGYDDAASECRGGVASEGVAVMALLAAVRFMAAGYEKEEAEVEVVGVAEVLAVDPLVLAFLFLFWWDRWWLRR